MASTNTLVIKAFTDILRLSATFLIWRFSLSFILTDCTTVVIMDAR